MKIVLFRPQIPQNTGNIARSCCVTNSELILVRPLGFQTSDKAIKRAGLDYWKGVKITFIDDLFTYLEATSSPFYFFSSHVEKPYTQITYSQDSILIFGSEGSGLPPNFNRHWSKQFATIPMKKKSRCLNLATSVGVVLYEALRQNQFSFGEEIIPSRQCELSD